MLSQEEYNSLLPFRSRIEQMSASIKQLQIIDPIMQRYGHAPICYNCSGSMMEAQRNVFELMVEYEKANEKI